MQIAVPLPLISMLLIGHFLDFAAALTDALLSRRVKSCGDSFSKLDLLGS